MFKIILLALVAVLLAVNLKAAGTDYSLYIGIAACTIISYYVLQKVGALIEITDSIVSMCSSGGKYVGIVIKIAGLTYVGELGAGLCRDCGHAQIANQIELALRLTILIMSLPVLTGLIGMINDIL